MLPPDTKVSTLSLFRSIDAGITVRGSIGYELPCFGVPVVTAGTGRYSRVSTSPSTTTSPESYLATLARLETVPRLSADAVRRAKVHAHALFIRRPWILRSFELEFGTDVTDPFYQNLHPTVGSDAEIARERRSRRLCRLGGGFRQHRLPHARRRGVHGAFTACSRRSTVNARKLLVDLECLCA